MKISYIAGVRIPTEKAHGIQIMKMCEAFALLGHEVDLILPLRRNPITQNVFDYYEIDETAREKIKIHYIKSIDLIRYGKIGFWIQTLWFAELAAIKMRKNYPDAVYSRDPLILLNMFFIHKNIVWEAHRGEMNWGIKTLLKKAKLVSITWGLAHIYEKLTQKILIAPDAVDLSEFNTQLSQKECREKVGLPLGKKIALYWGHLYGWKGVQIFADASDFFTNYELAVVVGGHKKDIEEFRSINKDKPHLLVVGQRPRNEISIFMKAADVLVLPNTGKEKISSHYTSPLKLFEYMASGTPIAASDLPSLQEVLDERNALFFAPDNPELLSQAVKEIFNNPELAQSLSAKALEDVQHYTWEKRAEKIAEFIQL